MRETTQGSNKKHYTYKVTRRLLDDPVELDNGVTFEYEVITRKAHPKKKSRNCRHQSSGRIRGRKYHRSQTLARKRSKSRKRKSRRRSHRSRR